MAPHATMGVSPSCKFMGRSNMTRLDIIHLNNMSNRAISANVDNRRSFQLEEPVWVRDYMSTRRWRKGVVTETTGPLTYVVEVEGKGG